MLGFSGESTFGLEFIVRMAAVFCSGLFLFFVGYYLKGIWGAIIALMLGTLLFLYEKGLLPALIHFQGYG
jgi:hypothetical protein